MIECTNKEYRGVRSAITEVTCDKCGCGVKYGPGTYRKIPRGDCVKQFLREDGWNFGKLHTCPKCLEQKNIERARTSPNSRVTFATPMPEAITA